jgi:flagellar M-ring protein FliF
MDTTWQRVRNQAVNWWTKTPLTQRLRVLAAVAAGVAVLAVLIGIVTSPNWQPLYTNLTAAEAGQITNQLQQMKVPYQLTQGGSTVLVPAAQVDQTRVELADQNIPSSGTVGFSNLTQFSLGETDQQLQVEEQVALQDELASTIASITAVQGAKVFLNEPAPTLFGEGPGTPSASVFVQLRPGMSLSAGQVRGIMNLVAHAVQGLNPSQVTVVDQDGTVLSAAVLAQNNSLTGTATQQYQAEQAVDNAIQQQVESLLTQVLGPGQAVVRVSSVLNFSSQSSSSVVYGGRVADAQQTSTSTTPGTALTPTGTSSNVPGVAAASGSSTGPSTSSTSITRYLVNTTTTKTTVPPGSIERLTIGVDVSQHLSAAQLQSLKSLVAQAAGLNPKRGDQLTLVDIPFNTSQAKAAQAELAATERRVQYIHWAEELVLLVAGVGLLTMGYRSIRRWQAARPPVVRPAGDALLAGAGGEDVSRSVAAFLRQLNLPPEQPEGGVDANLERLSQVVQKDPAHVARLLRTWLAEDEA